MEETERGGVDVTIERLRSQAASGSFRITQHAHQEMVEEEIALDEVLEAVEGAEILEHYPEHRRGACCLLNGRTRDGRPIHIVCTTEKPLLILITVYQPKPPKWVSPRERMRKP